MSKKLLFIISTLFISVEASHVENNILQESASFGLLKEENNTEVKDQKKAASIGLFATLKNSSRRCVNKIYDTTTNCLYTVYETANGIIYVVGLTTLGFVVYCYVKGKLVKVDHTKGHIADFYGNTLSIHEKTQNYWSIGNVPLFRLPDSLVYGLAGARNLIIESKDQTIKGLEKALAVSSDKLKWVKDSANNLYKSISGQGYSFFETAANTKGSTHNVAERAGEVCERAAEEIGKIANI